MRPIDALRSATSASADCLGVGNEHHDSKHLEHSGAELYTDNIALDADSKWQWGPFLRLIFEQKGKEKKRKNRCGRLAEGLSADLLLVASLPALLSLSTPGACLLLPMPYASLVEWTGSRTILLEQKELKAKKWERPNEQRPKPPSWWNYLRDLFWSCACVS